MTRSGSFAFRRSSIVVTIVGCLATAAVVAPPATAAAPVRTAPSAAHVVPVAAKRVVDTRTGLGVRSGRLKDGRTIDFGLFGVGGVPASGARSARLRVDLVDVTGSGAVSIYHENMRDPRSRLIHFAHGSPTASTFTLALARNGRVVMRNESPARFDLVVRVLGYTPEPSADDWPQHDGSAAETFANPLDGAVTEHNLSTLRRAWASSTNGVEASTSDPVVYRGMVLGGAFLDPLNTRVGLVARSLRTGRILWSTAIGAVVALAARAGVAYVTLGDLPGTVAAVDLATRRVLWARALNAPTARVVHYGEQVWADGGQVYVQEDGTRFVAFDALTGRLLWHVHGVGAAVADGVVAVFDGFNDIRDGRTGRLRGRIVLSVGQRYLIEDGYLVFFDISGAVGFRVAACRSLDCRPTWVQRTGLNFGDFVGGDVIYAAGGPDGNVLLAVEGVAAFPDPPSRLFLVDVHTGALRWSASYANGRLSEQPIVTHNVVLTRLDGGLGAIPLHCARTCTAHSVIRPLPPAPYPSEFDIRLVAVGRTVLVSQLPEDPVGVTAYALP